MDDTELEKQWEDGQHTSSSGKVFDIVDMPTPYLSNTINKYKELGYNTTVLENELSGRDETETI